MPTHQSDRGASAGQGPASLRRRVEALSWVHRIDLGGGLVTPGAWKRSALIDRALGRIDFQGREVLDVGTWDGLWAFDVERRGAGSVLAVDDTAQRSLKDQPTFQLAREALASKVQYQDGVDAQCLSAALAPRRFDVILFLGVYYHLKHPLLAFTELRRLLRPGGILVTEGPVIPSRRRAYAEFLYTKVHKNDPSNWYLPTTRCLEEWIECSFFEVTHLDTPRGAPLLAPLLALKQFSRRLLGRDQTSTYRCVVTATAVERDDPRYAFPDPRHAADDLRDYRGALPLSSDPPSRGAGASTSAWTPSED